MVRKLKNAINHKQYTHKNHNYISFLASTALRWENLNGRRIIQSNEGSFGKITCNGNKKN